MGDLGGGFFGMEDPGDEEGEAEVVRCWGEECTAVGGGG